MKLDHAELRLTLVRKLAILAALAIPATSAFLAPSPASAAPDSAVSVPAGSVKSGLWLVGFDADVARAHGYEVVTLPDGSQASVPAANAEAARKGEYIPKNGILKTTRSSTGEVTPHGYNEVPGDCGTSYVALWAQGNAAATLHTGFLLIPDAGEPWIVSWHVAISDRGGNSTQNYDEGDGNITASAWVAHLRMLHLTVGPATAQVTTGSWTLTWNGWFCWSYGPRTTETIY